MELKLQIASCGPVTLSRFNRTFMELKFNNVLSKLKATKTV